EHDEVPQRRIVPVRPIALVDDGQDARDDRAVLACPERADRAAAGERALALEDRPRPGRERRAAGTARGFSVLWWVPISTAIDGSSRVLKLHPKAIGRTDATLPASTTRRRR